MLSRHFSPSDCQFHASHQRQVSYHKQSIIISSPQGRIGYDENLFPLRDFVVTNCWYWEASWWQIFVVDEMLKNFCGDRLCDDGWMVRFARKWYRWPTQKLCSLIQDAMKFLYSGQKVVNATRPCEFLMHSNLNTFKLFCKITASQQKSEMNTQNYRRQDNLLNSEVSRAISWASPFL